MSTLELLLIALGLAMDCLAVSIGLATSQKLSGRTVLKIAFFFGLFQGLMPVLGWFAGESMKGLIEAVDHWIAFGLLAFIGGRMIRQSYRKEAGAPSAPLSLSLILSLSVATSIDALITGITFGFIDVNILKAAALIFAVTFLVTLAGLKAGEKISFLSIHRAERAGGIVLILIGLKILVEHLYYG